MPVAVVIVDCMVCLAGWLDSIGCKPSLVGLCTGLCVVVQHRLDYYNSFWYRCISVVKESGTQLHSLITYTRGQAPFVF